MTTAVRTYGTLVIIDKELVIEYAEPHVCIKLKKVFEQIDKSSIAPFKFNKTPENCAEMAWFIQRYPLSVSDSDFKKITRGAKSYYSRINELEKILLPDYVSAGEITLKEGMVARPYQLTGLELVSKVQRILIGDDLGLGKTLIGILTCLQPGALPAMVVVQSHLMDQWADQIAKFTHLNVHKIKVTKPYKLPPADVYIIKYTCLFGWVDFLQKKFFKTAIFDEIQELRHVGTGKYRASLHLSQSVNYAVGLSATPIFNYANEIFNILNLLKKGCLGDRDDFIREWCKGSSNDDKPIVDEPKALGTYLRRNFLFLRRTAKEVGMELPPVNKIVHTIDYDEAVLEEQEDLARTLALSVMTGGTYMERGQAAMQLNALVRHNTGVAKAKNVAEYVKMLLENDIPVILAGWHREVYEIWGRELKEYKPVFYTGHEGTAAKNESFRKFTTGETKLFIISLRSGAGIDGLQYICNYIVFGEMDWSPKVHDQLIGRPNRPGQEKRVNAIYLTSECGSDPLMIEALALKSSQSDAIIDPLAGNADVFSDSSPIKKLAEQYYNKLVKHNHHHGTN